MIHKESREWTPGQTSPKYESLRHFRYQITGTIFKAFYKTMKQTIYGSDNLTESIKLGLKHSFKQKPRNLSDNDVLMSFSSRSPVAFYSHDPWYSNCLAEIVWT